MWYDIGKLWINVKMDCYSCELICYACSRPMKSLFVIELYSVLTTVKYDKFLLHKPIYAIKIFIWNTYNLKLINAWSQMKIEIFSL